MLEGHTLDGAAPAKVRQATKGDLSNYSISCEEVEETVGFGGVRRAEGGISKKKKS
ncbi:MAG: hypothetical protein ACYSX1_07490 [Planctomycetota bacterium]